MRIIKLLEESDFKRFVRIISDAFPSSFPSDQESLKTHEKELIENQEKDPSCKAYGVFEKDTLIAGMFLWEFNMRFLSTKTRLGAIGLVSVDLMHKKEKCCKDMITYFIEHNRNQGVPLLALYSFSTEFYKKMGFGFGTKMNEYRVKPENLPFKGMKEHLEVLTKKDLPCILECYNRMADKTNGMLEKNQYMVRKHFEDHTLRTIGYRKDGVLLGYMVCKFIKETEVKPMGHDLFVKELIYENSEVLFEMLAFLNSQSTQVRHIILNTQDENLHYLLSDPRDDTGYYFPAMAHQCNRQGVGVMYRVIDLKGIFEVLSKHNFNQQSCKLRISISDNFYMEKNQTVLLYLENGIQVHPNGDTYDVEISMDVSDFSSLITGAVNFKSLYKYGLASISSPDYVDTVNRIFHTEDKPVCTIGF
ncbi:MAG: GNAT family N-acetyltransferase [Clostridia bacterium]|nr:GNAT family N-acetyltransferase [Clostridia bacterium]